MLTLTTTSLRLLQKPASFLQNELIFSTDYNPSTMQSTHTSIARGQVVASSSNPNSKQQRVAKPNSGSLASVCTRSSRNTNLGVRMRLCGVVG